MWTRSTQTSPSEVSIFQYQSAHRYWTPISYKPGSISSSVWITLLHRLTTDHYIHYALFCIMPLWIFPWIWLSAAVQLYIWSSFPRAYYHVPTSLISLWDTCSSRLMNMIHLRKRGKGLWRIIIIGETAETWLWIQSCFHVCCSNEPEESDCRTFDGSPTSLSLSLSAIEKERRGKDHNSFEVHLNHSLHILLRKFPLENVSRDGVLQAPLGFLSSWNGSRRLGGVRDVEDGGGGGGGWAGVNTEIWSNPISYSWRFTPPKTLLLKEEVTEGNKGIRLGISLHIMFVESASWINHQRQ